ncbi:PREDICTED: uncharacterized protein LOC106820699 [Priapulus caudatus]|uniref:Uncharacterized protein LOC106820699 n=1 Tax=Priapulus caudatus TaxID=37621 RepID=A0ABM1F8C0_PRICU|nr:PREDICTED: uncharacterized protein LOC106820699 [Priapulus caudatus]
MAGRGLGRGLAGLGRGRGALKAPGTIKKEDGYTLEKLMSEFCYMALGRKDDTEVSKVVEIVKKYSTTGSKLKEFATALHERCVNEADMITGAALLSQSLGSLEVDDVKFRNILLQQLQHDFKGKEAMRKENCMLFTNSFLLLCEVFSVLRVAGAPTPVLATPILTWLHLMVDADAVDHEVALADAQLSKLGKQLQQYMSNGKRLDALMQTVRERLLAKNTTTATRCHLLHMLELHTHGWQLTDCVTQFYTQQFDEIEREVR